MREGCPKEDNRGRLASTEPIGSCHCGERPGPAVKEDRGERV